MPQTEPSRRLRLTSPHTRGGDVRALQAAINNRRDARGLSPITVDGEYGPTTAAAYRGTARALGVHKSTIAKGATVGAQRVIEHPAARTPAQLVRARRFVAAEQRRQREQRHGGEAAVRLARTYIGVVEHPPNSNGGPKIDDWEREAGMGRGPWCGAFAHHVANACGADVAPEIRYTPAGVEMARSGRGGYNGFVGLSAAHPGDHVYFNFSGGPGPEHVGIFVRLDGQYVVTIDGNTAGNGGDQANGGGVLERRRPASLAIGAARVRWDS